MAYAVFKASIFPGNRITRFGIENLKELIEIHKADPSLMNRYRGKCADIARPRPPRSSSNGYVTHNRRLPSRLLRPVSQTLVFDTLGQHRLPLQRHPIIGGPVRSILLFGVNNETPAAG